LLRQLKVRKAIVNLSIEASGRRRGQNVFHHGAGSIVNRGNGSSRVRSAASRCGCFGRGRFRQQGLTIDANVDAVSVRVSSSRCQSPVSERS